MIGRDAPWREQRRAVAARLARAGVAAPEVDARRLVEEASGIDAAAWTDESRRTPTTRAWEALWAMCARREAGEPLQYVLGSWSFRGIDLMVDRRVLIPRPETETVVEIALDEAVRVGLRRGGRRRFGDAPEAAVADLGTGSGAIALALEAELPDVEVWATDVDHAALAVAAANVAGNAAARVRLASGSWFGALPDELRGKLALVVSNPPYVSEAEMSALPAEVVGYEPEAALRAGATGREAIEAILDAVGEWLAPGAALVCEIAPHHAGALAGHARAVGLVDVRVDADLTGRARVLVARRAGRS